MASGGRKPFSLSKLPQSDTRPTRYSGGDDQNDADPQMNSTKKNVPKEVRINNWDFADWRPNSASTDSKRRKKSKGNPEREREQSLSLDSPPQRDKKPRTPSTFPRTRIGPSTPTSQKRALENLRSRMTFSETDEGSTDGEPNNERAVPKRRLNPPNFSRQDTNSTEEGASQAILTNRNNNNSIQDPALDSNQIVGRLMQIRDYIKQANAMRDTLNKTKEPRDREKVIKLDHVIDNLVNQESYTLETLHQLSKSSKDDMDKLKKLVDNLKDQERGYMGLLQKMLALRDEGVLENGNGTLHGLLPDLEDNYDSDNDNDDDNDEDNKTESDDTVSVDLEVQTNASDTTTEERTNSSSSRPYIEDKLGDTDDENESRRSSKESNNMDNTLVAQRNTQAAEWDFGVDSIDGLDNLIPGSLDAMRVNELAALQQQQNLLKILAEKQEQLRALQGRQDALVAMHKEAEKKLHIAQNKENKAKAAVKSASEAVRHASNSNPNPNLTPTDDVVEDPISDLTSTQAQLEQLMMMKNRLEMLKNASTELTAEEEQAGNDMAILQTAEDDEPGRQQLQDKLEDLQGKKDRMNDLLKELQTLRSQRFETLIQSDEGGASAAAIAPPAPNSRSSSQVKLNEALSTLDQADSTAESAEQVLNMMDAQTKLEKLQEVKGRLDQLRGLVQYYQGDKTRTDGDGGEVRDQSSAPTYSDYGDTESLENARRAPIDAEKIFLSGSQLNALGNIPGAASRRRVDFDSQQSDEDNASINDSQMSSLGPWGDEPEIREKVRQLKATKEKLQQLQDLVSMVQQSPDMAQSLPDNIIDDDRPTLSAVKQTEDRNISVSEGEIPNDPQSGLPEAESIFSVKEQIKELSELKKERERLLALENQLQSLQGHFDQEENDDDNISDDRNDTESNKKSRSQSEPGPVVTFASNDELYSKMRKQRMLREELRSKKKELEAIMKKDRNKRQYFKNQDNQSDTVSYSTDAFGASASADATMATWGGSTVDNLENITEGRDDNDDDDEDDDAYPSDGIVQVEEEEEVNGSDNNTYTIEADARQRHAARSKPTQPDVRPKTRKIASFPRSQSAREELPMSSQNVNPLKKGAVRKTKMNKRTKQENYRSAEEIVRDVEVEDSSRLDLIQQQVQQTYQLLQEQQHNNTLQGTMSPNTSGLTMGNPMRSASGMYPDMLQQQMYQQQMMMSINQCYQQLNLQQIEMSNLNHHIQQINLYLQDIQHHQHHPINSSADDRDHSRLTPLATSSQTHISPHHHHLHLPQPPTRQSTFTLNPQFPLSFAPVEGSPRQHSSHRITSSSPSRQDVPQPQTNNLRPIPPPRFDSYPQNSNVNNFLGRDNQRDMRPKANVDFGKQKKSKDRPEEDYERSSQSGKSHGGQQGKDGRYRPGLCSGISGTGFSDSNSVTDALSARLGEPRNRDGDAMELSLFETLRETIYSEVATLISQNESRPHFLIELFRELQLLSSDYLRQRGLYAIQELVSKTLSTEDNPYVVQSRWSRDSGGGVDNLTASELTPSESILTSDDESKVVVEKKKKKLLLNRSGSLKNNQFDYCEQAENTSTLSTPSTGLAESPFANESLGDTVIHLDKALERMREMERKEIEGRLNEESLQVVYNQVREARQAARILDDNKLAAGSGADNGSQGSIPDIMYSRINSGQLDDQVKEIIREIIPVIKEHTDDICSPQLLAYIKRLVLSLTRQNDSRHEFTSFFHSQLGSILHDSLARFEGRKVRECGDDLLDSMSDALYDELAFFRMMQDLNNPNLNNKNKSNQSSKTSSPHKSPLHARIINKSEISDDGNDVSTSEDSDDDSQNNLRVLVTEEEDLGKERDDELASEMPIQDADEKDQETESPYKSRGLKIELAVSETKPFTRIGSDEDDDNDSDESHSAEDPSETAVSRDAKLSSQPDRAVEINGNLTSPNRPVTNINGNSSPSHPMGNINGVQSEEDGDVTADKPTADNHTVLSNGDVDNNNDLTIDDLPTTLNITASKEIEKKVAEEQNELTGENGILSTMETQEELAGDGTALKDPDSFGK